MGRVATEEELEQGDFVIPKTLGAPDNTDLLGDDDEEEEDEDLDPMLLALQEEMEGLRSSQKEERELFQNLISQVLAKPQQASPQQQEQQDVFSLDDLPDPVEDRAGFNKELSTRVQKLVTDSNTATANAVLQKSNSDQSLRDLENRFNTSYPDLSKKQSLFTAVLTDQVGRLKNKGVDAQAYVFADPDKFLKTVAKNMRDELGIDDEDLDDEDELGNKTVRKSATGKRKSRTKGVRSSSSPAIKRKSGNRGKKPVGFVAELKRQQAELGIV